LPKEAALGLPLMPCLPAPARPRAPGTSPPCPLLLLLFLLLKGHFQGKCSSALCAHHEAQERLRHRFILGKRRLSSTALACVDGASA